MSDDDDVKQVLRECFPDECDAVGPSALDNIIGGRTNFERPRTTRAFPIDRILAELSSAVVVIRAIIDIWRSLSAKLGREPEASEIKQESEKREDLKGLASEQLDKLIRIVIKIYRNVI